MAKTTTKLSWTFCTEAKAGPKQILWWDGGDESVKGFALRISPQRVEGRGKDKRTIGGSKSFWLKLTKTLKDPETEEYILDAKGQKIIRQTWTKIGNFPDISVEDAREKARKHRANHFDGGDVKEEVVKQRNPQDVNALVDAYLVHIDFTELRESSKTSIKSHLKRYIKPLLGKRKVPALTLADVDGFYVRVFRQTSKVTANRCLSLLSVLCELALVKGWGTGDGWARGNPCKLYRGRKDEKARERKLSLEEFSALGKALDECEENAVAVDAIRFLAVTGLRLGEALGLTWKDVDFKKRVMVFRRHKTSSKAGTKRLPINDQGLAILRRREQAKVLGNDHVFTGHKRGEHYSALDRNWNHIHELAGLGDSPDGGFHMHDFRRVFMSTCQEVGYPLAIAKTLLGHSLGKITDTYTALDPTGILAQASNATGEWIAEALAGREPVVGKKVSHA